MVKSICQPDASNVESLPMFAVAIFANGQSHAGVLFRDAAGGVSLLHLAGHEKLKVEVAKDVVPDNYCWAIPPYKDMELRQLAGFARVQAKRKRAVAFSFRYIPDEYKYVKGGDVAFKNMAGLTCATYVLSIIDYLKLPLLDYSTWLPRDDDGPNQEHMLRCMSLRVPPEHYEKAKREVGSLRFRPQEVVGACLTDDQLPVPLPAAELLGNQVMDTMREFYRRVGVI